MKIALCYSGTEDIIEKDLNGKKLMDGRVSFESGNNFGGVRTVYSLIDNFNFKDYSDLIDKISNINFKFEGSFKVSCVREGEHDFDSQTCSKEVGETLYNKGFKVDLKAPKNIIYLDVVGDHCLVGFLEQDNLSKRDYKVRLVAQSLNASVAYCVAKQLVKGDAFDPFVKDGVVAIETAKLDLGRVYVDDTNKHNLGHVKTNAALAEVDVELTSFMGFKEKVNIVTFLPGVFSRTKSNEFIIEQFFNKANEIANQIVVCTFNPDMAKKYCKLKLKSEREVIVGANHYYVLVW